MIRDFQVLGKRWLLAASRDARRTIDNEGRSIPGTMLYVTLPTQLPGGGVRDKKPDEQAVRYAAKKGVIVHHSYLEFSYINGTDFLGGVRFRVKAATNESDRYPNSVNGAVTVPGGGNVPLGQAILKKANNRVSAADEQIDPTPTYAPYQNKAGQEVIR